MNFSHFYKSTENRLSDSILSLWAPGNKDMQHHFKYILQQEPILAEPVFQAMYPWEAAGKTFENTGDVLHPDLINAFDNIKDKEFRFPKDRYPYKHQLASWKALLNNKKSIAVTTGTGSGKTECFMIPVLNDIYEHSKNDEGINAIFLYPLNALIASQKKRLHAWCEALPGLRYALLTGNTKHKVNEEEKKKSFPELIDRESIRKSPPQILFTNQTMLEYMLVRHADAPILQKSEGKLRWILLDEAHTLKGSAAAEMALLIRRVLIAFKCKIGDVRFAITSATVGDKDSAALKKFMANLCNISEEQITIIGGQRVLDYIPEDQIKDVSPQVTASKINTLRSDMLRKSALGAGEIGEYFGARSLENQLQLIDRLAETQIEGENLLPLRGHFFTRGIGGVYVCTNPGCTKHQGHLPSGSLGAMSTIADKTCVCGYPLLELIACSSCGNMMLEGEVDEQRLLRQTTTVGFEAFAINGDDDTDEEDEHAETHRGSAGTVRLLKNQPNQRLSNEDMVLTSISHEGQLVDGEDYLYTDQTNCPHCGGSNDNPMHFRVSAAFTNRALADVILEHTPGVPEKDRTAHTLYEGRKYIAFTDSRQGTAKTSALINIDSETHWVRYRLYHFLLSKLNTEEYQDPEQLITERSQLLSTLPTMPPLVRTTIENRIAEIDAQIKRLESGQIDLESTRTSIQEITEDVQKKPDFDTLFKQSGTRDSTLYAKGLLLDQIARRLPRERSLENLGLISVVYPPLDNIALPLEAEVLGISLDEWKDLLKIALDYSIRNQHHFNFEGALYTYTTKRYHPKSIYPTRSQIENVPKWKEYNPKASTVTRLALLICAGLDWHTKDALTEERQDQLNELLQKIWTTLTQQVLVRDGDSYRLDLFSNKVNLQLIGRAYLCPATNRLVDRVFRGYSPWIKGRLDEANILHYRLREKAAIEIPTYDYVNHLTPTNEQVSTEQVDTWIEANSQGLREKGVWNDYYEKIFRPNHLFLAGEHSAQISQEEREELEGKFGDGKVSILSCSTTMEMGVDIGGISAVVMSNVPPMPANYLQRAGRAGRREENKSLALTICAPNPVGLRTMNDPKWALEHEIASPFLRFDSKTIVERHINSFFLGEFVRGGEKAGLDIKQNINGFFFSGQPTIGEEFLSWLQNLNTDSYKADLNTLKKSTLLEQSATVSLKQATQRHFERIVSEVAVQKNAFEEKLKNLADSFGDNSPAYKALNYRKNQFLNKHVLGYLAENNFLPNAGLPTGIVEFEKTTLRDIRDKHDAIERAKGNPTYVIARALTEYAPGNEIIIQGLNYRSAGIMMKTQYGAAAQRDLVQACRNCGFQRIVNTEDNIQECPHCQGSGTFSGIQLRDHRGGFTEVVEPTGFAVDIYEEPKRGVSERSKSQYLEPLLINLMPWSGVQRNILDIRTSDKSEDASILFYNTGGGSGYSLCLGCGRVESSGNLSTLHKRLRGGKQENGNKICLTPTIRDHIVIGARIRTDFTEVRLLNSAGGLLNDKSTIYTLGLIFSKSLADFLAVEDGEIDFGIKDYGTHQTFFIFDTAKGGAGYATRLGMYIEKVMEKSRSILRKCDCVNGCTKCLVDRKSQWHIEQIDKVKALDWLEFAQGVQVPEELKNSYNNVDTVLGTLGDEIRTLDYHHGVREIRFYLDPKIANWETDDLEWLKQLYPKDITCVVTGDAQYDNNLQDKLTIHKLSGLSTLKQSPSMTSKYKTHLEIVLHDNSCYKYISDSPTPSLQSELLTMLGEKYYRVEGLADVKLNNFRLPEIKNSGLYQAEVRAFPSYSIKSSQLAKVVLDKIDRLELSQAIASDTSYQVDYYDKYNQSEFSLRLLLQFVDKVAEQLNIKISELRIHLNGSELYKNVSTKNWMNIGYSRIDHYKGKAQLLEEDFDFDIHVINNDKNKMPHYRIFEFRSADKAFQIRIDGGIAHGLGTDIKANTLEDENIPFNIYKYVSYPLIYDICVL